MRTRLMPLLLCLLLVEPLAAAEKSARPNIVLIMGDDMGFSDIGCYGSEIRTPNLDALATNGVRFTHFYNTARCCPTRASLLTGLYPHQAGVGHMMEDRGAAGYRGRLNDQCVTIAEVLKDSGYRTYATGKWHVTPGPGRKGEPDKHNWPLQRGFDRYYGTIQGAGSYFDPSSLVRNNTLITVANDPEYQPKEFYYTDAIADHAVQFIRDHKKQSPDQPFFLYTAFTAAHWPLHAKETDIAKYKGRYDDGYEPIRAARFAKARQSGLLDDVGGLSPAAEQWDDVKNKAFERRCMEVYAAQIDSMDQAIGRIIAELKADGLFENTLVLFLQDNGGCAENIGRTGAPAARPDSPTLPRMDPDEQQYGSQPKQTRDGFPVRQGYGVMPGAGDTYIAYGRGWANVSNTPFREYKHWTHEGGISTPLIAHWPAGMAGSRRNALEKAPAHLIDIMATCVDLAGANYPKERNGKMIKPMQGVSLKPVFQGEPLQRPQPIFWEHEANRAVRTPKWKLVAKENQPWELYDMERDRSELNNVAASHPELVRDLAAQWDDYARRSDVLPLGGWKARESAANFSKEKRFVLTAGDRLPRREAPAISDQPFTITARFDTRDSQNGVIVAQGGSRAGYTLYLKDGKLAFEVRTGSKTRLVQTSQHVTGRHTAVASLDAHANLALSLDGKEAATAKGIGLIDSMPMDGLDVGSDEQGAVGDYKGPFRFGGTIEEVKIELGE